MLFNGIPFLLFFGAVALVHHVLLRGRWHWQKRALLAASWIFYATWSPAFLVVLLGTTWIDFHLAHRIHAARSRAPRQARAWLIVSVALNLSLLAFFKYGGFLYGTAAGVLALPPTPGILRIAVPLGISFYTFHAISYVVDTYRGLRPPTTSLADYALYVAFFPQLIAGPITRWGFFGPQLATPRAVVPGDVERAAYLLARGFLKKVVFADTLGAYVDDVFDLPLGTGTLDAWLAVYAYAFQIYFDFSGYTDIAQGLAYTLGFRLPPNFDHPYVAADPSEFWRRWHISLSTWLRDYLYIGLGGNRRGTWRTYRNLLVTMLLGGLWHGAAWTFVAWGAFHGLWLAVHRALTADGARAPVTPRWVRQLVTFHLVALAWVPFRAASFGDAGLLFARLFAWVPPASPLPVECLAIVALGVATQVLGARTDPFAWWSRLPRPVHGVVYALVIVAVGLCSSQTARFIYFAF